MAAPTIRAADLHDLFGLCIAAHETTQSPGTLIHAWLDDHPILDADPEMLAKLHTIVTSTRTNPRGTFRLIETLEKAAI